MAKIKVIKKLIQGIGSLFKEKGESVPALFKTAPKDPDMSQRVFFNNLIDDFGETEVKESVDILKDAWSTKLFFPGGPKGVSFEDDLVNLLEGRHFGSQRIQASPINFNRRGAGSADRYMMPKLGEEVNRNVRRTDLPGGPGDPDLYKNHWGEMSGTVRTDGTKVWTSKPSIVDEYADDVVTKIKGNKNVSPEDIDFAFNRGMRDRMGSKGIPAATKADDMVQQMDDMTREAEATLEFAKRDQQQISDAMDTFNRMMADGEDPAEAIRMLKQIMKMGRTKNAKGGRVGLFRGGLSALLKRVNPSLEKQMVKTGPFQTGHRADAVADMEQIKNITRNEATELERIYELEDMIQNSPRYDKKMKAAFMELIDYEKFRANKLYDNPKLQRHMKNDPEGTEAYLKWLYKSEGSDSGFNMGGRVGYAEGNIVAPTGYVSPSEMKTAAGYLSPYAMMTDAGYEPTPGEQAEELKKRLAEANPVYEMLFDAIERETAANGGRIGMLAGGKLLGEGIMQAAKLAQKGIRPWGSKQIHRQKVTKKGASNFDQVEEMVKIEIEGNVDAQDIRGLFDLYEDVVTGKQLGLLNDAQRMTILKRIEDGMQKIPMDKSFKEDLGADLGNLREFYSMTAPKTAEIIPFPRKKKAMGGQIGVGSLFRSK